MKTADTKTQTETRCHCGDKAMYTVKIDYIWRETVRTSSGKTATVSRSNQVTMDLCEDCYPGTKLHIQAEVPPL
jgi:hypothetical protein